MIMQGTYDPSFDIALHCKDNQLCYEIARKHKVNIYTLAQKFGVKVFRSASKSYKNQAAMLFLTMLGLVSLVLAINH